MSCKRGERGLGCARGSIPGDTEDANGFGFGQSRALELTAGKLREALSEAASWHEVQSLEAFPGAVLPSVHGLLEVDATGWNEIDVANGAFDLQVVPGDAPFQEDVDVLTRLIEQHPLLMPLTVDPGSPAAFSDVTSRRELERLELYQEFHRPHEIRNQMAFRFSMNPWIAIAVNRSRGDFTPAQRELAAILRPHLESAYGSIEVRERALRRFAALEAGVERAAGAIVLLTEEGEIEYASELASALMERWFASRGTKLPYALAQLEHRGTFSRPDAQLVAVRVATEPPLLLLHERRPRPDPERARALGLTRRETEVTHACRGRNDQPADRRGDLHQPAHGAETPGALLREAWRQGPRPGRRKADARAERAAVAAARRDPRRRGRAPATGAPRRRAPRRPPMEICSHCFGSACSGSLASRARLGQLAPVLGGLGRAAPTPRSRPPRGSASTSAGSCRRRSRGARSPGRGSGRTTASPRPPRASRRPRRRSRRSAGSPSNSPSGGSSIVLRALARSRPARGRAGRPAQLRIGGQVDHVPREREHRLLGVAGLLEALERGRLQVLEGGVREPGQLVVIAGEDDRVAGEVGGAAVVVEVVEVGEQDRRPALVDGLPRQSPGSPPDPRRCAGAAEPRSARGSSPRAAPPARW